MKRRTIFLSLLSMPLGFTGCGQGGGQIQYQYKETKCLGKTVMLADPPIRHITKSVYTPGVLKLYYEGNAPKGSLKVTKCFGRDFEDLGKTFEALSQEGILTVQADFANRISGLRIEDPAHNTTYHLRYLDSPQFAWLADIYTDSFGVIVMGDQDRYFDALFDAEQAAILRESRNNFALLEGTWVSEDGLQKYVFSAERRRTKLTAEKLQFDELNQKWHSVCRMTAQSADQKPYFRTGTMLWSCVDETGKSVVDPIEIRLVDGSPSEEEMKVLYDRRNLNNSENQLILIDSLIYCRTSPQE